MASVEWGAIGTSKGARRRPVDGMADDLARRANRPPISGPPPAGPASESEFCRSPIAILLRVQHAIDLSTFSAPEQEKDTPAYVRPANIMGTQL